MAVHIEGINKSGAAFHRSVDEELEPAGHDARGSKFTDVGSPLQGLVHIHPALYLVGQAQHEVQLPGLVLLLGGLIVVGVDEIVAPSSRQAYPL